LTQIPSGQITSALDGCFNIHMRKKKEEKRKQKMRRNKKKTKGVPAHPLGEQIVEIETQEPSLHRLGVDPEQPGNTGHSWLVRAQDPSQQLNCPEQEFASQREGLETHELSMHRKGEVDGQGGGGHSNTLLTQRPSGHWMGQTMTPVVEPPMPVVVWTPVVLPPMPVVVWTPVVLPPMPVVV
jgi:hypothetical protein